MYKSVLIIGMLTLVVSPVLAQTSDSIINKCDNGKGPIIYTEFDCPEGYEAMTDSWLSETNMTSAAQFGDESQQKDNSPRNNSSNNNNNDNGPK